MTPGLYSAVPSPPALDPRAPLTPLPYRPVPTRTTPIDIEAWTVSALASLRVSPSAIGIGSPLAIPLDDDVVRPRARAAIASGNGISVRRPPSTRDVLQRREERRKGKEGTRQRRRWDNDRLIGVPNAEPPQPVDFLPRPTHPVNHVPYHVAQFWDKGLRQRIDEKTAALQSARKRHQLRTGSATGLGVGQIPRDLRESAKRTPAVKTWVRELEGPVRRFAGEWIGGEGEDEKMAGDEEEVLFAGRKGVGERDGGWKRARREMGDGRVEPGMVFETPGDDEAAALKRYLAHAISDYYGLESRSTTVGNPGRRVVYLGVKSGVPPDSGPAANLPRPMWEVC